MSDIHKSFTDLQNVILNLDDDNKKNENDGRKIKSIRHFSDGELVEYEDDDEVDIDTHKDQLNIVQVDPKSLSWVPWTLHQTSWLGSKVLHGCDYAGETLANFLGITSPKYQFEINEYNRIKKTEDAEKRQEQVEMAGWKEQHKYNDLIETSSGTNLNNQQCVQSQ